MPTRNVKPTSTTNLAFLFLATLVAFSGLVSAKTSGSWSFDLCESVCHGEVVNCPKVAAGSKLSCGVAYQPKWIGPKGVKTVVGMWVTGLPSDHVVWPGPGKQKLYFTSTGSLYEEAGSISVDSIARKFPKELFKNGFKVTVGVGEPDRLDKWAMTIDYPVEAKGCS
ncbi:hypothetical protein T439DRAFT_138308 [Meredithblackwellia eburnea MCA 4105]